VLQNVTQIYKASFLKINMKKTKIEEIDIGIGFYSGKWSVIFLNKNLKKYPKLYNKVLKHELKHSKTSGFFRQTWVDIKDIKNIFYLDWLIFLIRHPRALFPGKIRGKLAIPIIGIIF